MPGALSGAVLVVRQDGVDLRVLELAVDHHHRHPGVHQAPHVPGTTGRRDDDAGDLLRHRGVDVLLLAPGVVVAVEEQHRVTGRLGDVLHTAEHRREERVPDVRDDHRPEAGTAATQVPRHRVGPVVEVLHGLADPFGQAGVHVRAAVHHARHRGRRHLGAARDIVNRGHKSPFRHVAVPAAAARAYGCSWLHCGRSKRTNSFAGSALSGRGHRFRRRSRREKR